ncbi:MAG: tRNA (adenosine(37)-N6)-threonylcarbamoyltransferase complex dimerization subunit type 1 TsaB, partial [Chloroflexi bacterium]|nr:tRNA (adenosine(37)-N6)-threonylcarbamoyltransferase complex dimerization subunit type 1 TsaB [Chloroflexota bacterium]
MGRQPHEPVARGTTIDAPGGSARSRGPLAAERLARVNERVDLAIDTASDDVAVALVRGGAVLAERRWRLAGTASEELLGGVDALLREAGVARDEIAAIAVNVGPGGYGGLRTGVATAQGLALALDVPLAGVSRLEADAYPHLLAAPEGAPVAAAHDAGRAGVAWAAY